MKKPKTKPKPQTAKDRGEKRRKESALAKERRARQQVFLATLRENPNVTEAAQAAGVSRTHAYTWRDPQEYKDADAFAAAWDEAIEECCDKLEGVAFRLATASPEPNPQLLWKLLQSYRPSRFKEQIRVEDNGKIPRVIFLPPLEDKEQ